MTSTAPDAESRRPSRQDRQARVGILRNPNSTPAPPPRRAQLMGRWPSLRSGRRATAQQIARAARALVKPDHPLPVDAATVPSESDPGGQTRPALGLDLVGLMASVEGIGTDKPIRTPYGAEMRPDLQVDSPRTTAPAPPSILSPDAWIEPDETDRTEPAPIPDQPASRLPHRHRCRSRGLLLAIVGLALALAILVSLPAGPGL